MTEKFGLKKDELSNRNIIILLSALFVLLIYGTIVFGFKAIWIALVAYVAAVIVEFTFAKIRKKKMGLSFLITPLIFALMMPVTMDLWIVAVGSAFGVFFGKMIFGGQGKNIFNPALVGVLFVTVSFPLQMNTRWLNPETDLVSAVTPLISLNKSLPMDYTIMELMLGHVPGVIGETFRLGILVLGLLLILLKVIDWRIPLSLIGTLFVFTWIGNLALPNHFIDPVYSLFVGGLMFAAFFVATDPVSMPMKSWGRIIYGVGIGLLTIIIRNFATFPEGLTFSIVIMNAISPLIDSLLMKEESKEEETHELES
ncbi:MAG: RnfABCDGE type electron transport complex subunit D [Acholeplasmataceae bacterium]|nr:RnfABCDGE type electron transport complex subunit D [Acholeplasmataceae bacterium]MDD4194238.1 RnfABCDGE type electron transport complex subunit D [Acholeplasmataceae bacterium]